MTVKRGWVIWWKILDYYCGNWREGTTETTILLHPTHAALTCLLGAQKDNFSLNCHKRSFFKCKIKTWEPCENYSVVQTINIHARCIWRTVSNSTITNMATMRSFSLRPTNLTQCCSKPALKYKALRGRQRFEMGTQTSWPASRPKLDVTSWKFLLENTMKTPSQITCTLTF